MLKEIQLPEISENVESGTVISILVKTGEIIEQQQPIIEIETEKATFEVPSPIKGRIAEIKIRTGQTINVGETIVKVETDLEVEIETKQEKEPQDKTDKQPSVAPQPQKETKQEKTRQTPVKEKEKTSSRAAPASRQLAHELGIDITNIQPSQPDGLITIEDVKNYARQAITKTAPAQFKSSTKPLPDFTKWGNIHREPMTTIRSAVAENLSASWPNVPQVTQHDQADITEMEEFRKEYEKKVEDSGGKLTVTSIMLKVVASALKMFPKFNASLDLSAKEIIYKNYINIAVAVDTDRGLVVPVIKNVDQKTILQLSIELTEIAQKARDHKIAPDEMVGGNFTISNLGGIGGTGFTPIVYWPQVAILGLSRSTQTPAYIDNILQPRKILPLSLSYDHRIIDGAESAKFLKQIVHMLQEPFVLALQE